MPESRQSTGSTRRLCTPNTHPTQRANSCPKVANPFCRLPLPTFFHQLEAAHLGDLLRLWVRRAARAICLLRFSRVVAHAPNTAQRSVLCQPWQPSLRAMRFHGVRQCLHAHMQAPPSGCQGKEKSLLGARSNVSGLGCVAACAPRARAGMLAGFPFGAVKRCLAAASHPSAFRLPLRIASPASNCCSRGTLPHFSLQSIACSFEYLLLPPRSALESVPHSLAAYASPRSPRPPTRSHITCMSGEVWVARLSAIHFQG